MDTLVSDLRLALRSLLKRPVFALVAIATLALGIGANTAAFSVVNGVLLKALPYKDAGRLLMVWTNDTRQGNPRNDTSPADFQDLKSGTPAFSGLAAITPYSAANLKVGDEVERVPVLASTSDLFSILGVPAALGRTLQPADDTPGKPTVVVLSDAIWHRRFGADPHIVGSVINLNGNPVTVVGVMPPGFRIPVFEGDIYAPLALDERTWQNRAFHFLWMVGRLAPGATRAVAQTQITTVARRLEAAYPGSNTGMLFTATPLREAITGDVQPLLYVVLGTVGLVLLIACANIANLLLARAATRGREIAVRAALGARRGRLVRQLLTESLVLSVLGAGSGLVLASWAVDAVRHLDPRTLPLASEVTISGPVLLFTMGIAVLTALLFGLAPALTATRTDLNEALKDGGRGGTTGREGARLRASLVVAQVALAAVLLVGAGLLLRSFARLTAVDPGYVADHALTFTVRPAGARYRDGTAQIQFFDDLMARLAALPGVTAVGGTNQLPPRPGVTSSIVVEGQPVPERPLEANYREVTPDYFKALGVPVVDGRGFVPADRADSTRPVLVNQTFARRFFPGTSPIGQRVKTGPNARAWNTIVGVVRDVHDAGPAHEPHAEIYNHYAQSVPGALNFVLRTSGDAGQLTAPARAAVRAIDPDLPLYNVATLADATEAAVAQPKLSLTLVGMFAGLAMALSLVGTYGVLAFTVAQRTHEIGIRMALGAGRADVVRLIWTQGLGLAALGLGLGLVLSFPATRAITTLLFATSARDPLTYVIVAVALLGAVSLACLVPARRAAKTDPMVALRYE